jgi:hypothetical protein
MSAIMLDNVEWCWSIGRYWRSLTMLKHRTILEKSDDVEASDDIGEVWRCWTKLGCQTKSRVSNNDERSWSVRQSQECRTKSSEVLKLDNTFLYTILFYWNEWKSNKREFRKSSICRMNVELCRTCVEVSEWRIGVRQNWTKSGCQTWIELSDVRERNRSVG